MAAGQRRKFTPEFRDEAVRLVLDTGRPVAEVGRDIGVVEGTLGNWVNLWRTPHAGEEPALNVGERVELAQLRRDNQTLRMEREFLKKAALDSTGQRNTLDDQLGGGAWRRSVDRGCLRTVGSWCGRCGRPGSRSARYRVRCVRRRVRSLRSCCPTAESINHLSAGARVV